MFWIIYSLFNPEHASKFVQRRKIITLCPIYLIIKLKAKCVYISLMDLGNCKNLMNAYLPNPLVVMRLITVVSTCGKVVGRVERSRFTTCEMSFGSRRIRSRYCLVPNSCIWGWVPVNANPHMDNPYPLCCMHALKA